MECPVCHATVADESRRCAVCGSDFEISLDAETLAPGGADSESTAGGTLTPARRAPSGRPTGLRTPVTSPGRSSPGGSRSRSSLDLGSDFGPRYHIEALLGKGGMGEVYKAYDKELDRTVAIKLVLSDLAEEPETMQRFKQELLMASKVSHRNILRIHDLGDVDGVKFISMAYVEGEDLHHVLKREGGLPLDRVVKITRQLCGALAAAHAEGVVHRDLKPQNVLIDKADNIYVSDFGLAKSLEVGAVGMTRTGDLLGTPRYMAPEQALRKPVDHRADIYSLGLIIYEMATGRVPFTGDSAIQVMLMRINEKPKSPKEFNPDLPDYLVRIIMRCLEKEPERRYQSANEILADLDAERASPAGFTLSMRNVQINLPMLEEVRGGWWAGAAALVVLIAALAIPSVRRFILRQPPPAASTSAVSGVPPLSQGKYLAVLPLRVLGGDASLNYIAEGLADGLTARLFQMREVHVASSTDKVNLADPPDKIARELGANLVLRGDLQNSGDQIRIIVTLQDVAGAHPVWSAEFSGSSRDVLKLEDQIFARLAPALELKPEDIATASAASHPTENVDAYQLYLKGNNAFHNANSAGDVQKAIDFYQDALKKDSAFAQAYAGLAHANLQMYRATKNNLWAERAVGAAQQAEHLNENLPEVHLALGSAYSATGRYAEAIAELDQALQLAPNSDEAYRRLGDAYLPTGQKDKAFWAFQKAVDNNPYDWSNYASQGVAYFNVGDYAKALAAFRHITGLEPDSPIGYEDIGNVYLQQGKFAESVAPLEKALSLKPTYDVYLNLGTAYFFQRQFDRAVKMATQALQLNPNDQAAMGNLADAYRWSGQSANAAESYRKAIVLANAALAVNPRDAETMGTLALYYAKTGDARQAQALAEHARSLAPDDVNVIYDEAVVYVLAGHTPNALQTLREAFQKGLTPDYAKGDPQLDSLKSNPEFERLLKEFTRQGS
ncbi:MAG: protein kinase domain-containing protein [Terriglobia bacterium]